MSTNDVNGNIHDGAGKFAGAVNSEVDPASVLPADPNPVEQLSELNTNYDPPQPWKCITHSAHDCDGQVIGKVGAIPVCAAGAIAEHEARRTDDLRIQRLMADPTVQAQMRAEQAFESRWS